jgi:hypothetical protein
MFEAISGNSDMSLMSELDDLSRSAPRQTFRADLWHFIRHNRKWWLTPPLLVLLLVGLLLLLSGTAAAPFIYTLF